MLCSGRSVLCVCAPPSALGFYCLKKYVEWCGVGAPCLLHIPQAHNVQETWALLPCLCLWNFAVFFTGLLNSAGNQARYYVTSLQWDSAFSFCHAGLLEIHTSVEIRSTQRVPRV